jgi:Uma2 family endonuclease
MVRSAAVRFTYQDYLNLPEDRRYEILDGDLLMSPSPTERHQRLLLELALILTTFVKKHQLGRVYVAPFDVVLSETDVVQPDILFVSADRASIVGEKAVRGAPDLVVEVLSPATAERDRTVKAKLYARAGVRELWLVDPDSQTLEILVNTESGFCRHSLSSAHQIAGSALLLDFRIDLASLFA